VLAILLGAGLRRAELASLDFEHIQERDGRWVIVDLAGKQGRIRSVPIPLWAHAAVSRWKDVAGISEGAVFRSVTRHGRLTPRPISPQGVFMIVKTYADQLHAVVRPHDLRRSFARLAHTGSCRLFFSQAAGRIVKFRDFAFPGLGRDGLLRITRITRSNETMTILVDFVERDGTAADRLDFTLNLPA
jgi:integrase